MYFLVVRNEKKENLKVLEFKTFDEAESMHDKMLDEGFKGELVVGSGKNKEAFLKTFTEYR